MNEALAGLEAYITQAGHYGRKCASESVDQQSILYAYERMTTKWQYPKTTELSLREMLARNIRIRRNQLGISQEELAELCGLHRTYIGAVERAERNISADNIEKIALTIGVSPSHILAKPPDQ